MQLFSLQQQLSELSEFPLEQWHPPFCGSMPIRIDRDGQWHYQDSPIQRLELVRLFAAVLSCQDGRYLLTTPAEQVEIQVDDAPFLLVQAEWLSGQDGPLLQLTTNLQQHYVASAACPVLLQPEPGSGQLLPYLQLKRGLRAKFSRNLYYQLAEQAQLQEGESPAFLLQSGAYRFALG